jgi:uncharacterized protein YbjT (DUF2867 family)
MLATTGERVLVIGAAGVLGSLTAQVFEDAGWEVFRGSRIAHRDAGWRRIHLSRPETLGAGLEGIDVPSRTPASPQSNSSSSTGACC